MKKNENLVIYVGNLTYDVDESQLEAFFEAEVGNIVSTRIIRDAGTNQSRGFGFVEFSDSQSAAQAIGYNGMEFAGRQLKVNYSEPKRPNNNNTRRRHNNHHSRGGYQQQQSHPQYATFPSPYGFYNMPVIPNSPPQNQIHTGYPNQHMYTYQSSFSPQQLIYANPQHVHNSAYAYPDNVSLQGTLSNVSSSSDLNKHYQPDPSRPVTITTPEKNESIPQSVLTPDGNPYAYGAYAPMYSYPKQQQQQQNLQNANFGPQSDAVNVGVTVDIVEANPTSKKEDEFKIQPSLPPGGAQ